MSKADNKELDKNKKAIKNFKDYIKTIENRQEYLYNDEEFYKEEIEQNELFLKMLHNVLDYIENSISKEEYDKIKEENEMLKLEERSRIIGKYGEVEVHDLINQVLSKDYISKEVIKEKKQELEKEYKEYLEENSTKAFILKCQLEILEELVEGE